MFLPLSLSPSQAGVASLSGLQCAKPTKADENNRQSGQTTKYRLLLTVSQPQAVLTGQPGQGLTGQAGQLAPVAPLVSEAFTLVTTRSKAAVKSAIPLPGEHVSVLEGVGKDAVDSLRSLGRIVRPAAGLPAHLASVDKVR